MTRFQLIIISYSFVLIPFLTSLFLFKKIKKDFYPFLYLIWLMAVADLSSLIFMLFFKKSGLWVIIININGLCESLLLMWIFKNRGLFNGRIILYAILQASFIFSWIIEVAYFSDPFDRGLYFSIYYNFIASLLLISMINKLTKLARKPLYDEPVFVICSGLLVYVFGELLPVIFSLNFLDVSRFFQRRMLVLADAFVTLMYLIVTYGLILMARRRHSKNNTQLFRLTPSERLADNN